MLNGTESSAPHDHRVRFYEGDAELVGVLAAWVTDGLEAGERVVVVATAAHRSALAVALAANGVDVVSAQALGTFVALDARATMNGFMASGSPDPARFQAAIRGVLHSGGAAAPVRIFGEIVALLWEEGNAGGAIRLEALWNELANHEAFTLLCAYPTWMVQSGRLGDLKQVCEEHSAVLPPVRYGSPTTTSEDGDLDQRSEVFIPTPQAIGAARRFVNSTLGEWGLQSVAADAQLVVSEMATNALVHAKSPFRVYLHRAQDVMFLCLKDAGSGVVEVPVGHAQATNGRGVSIVEALSDRWGCDQLADGKVVWAEFSGRADGHAGAREVAAG